jgi:hypothetical protein
MSTSIPKPRFPAAVSATTTLINFGVSQDTLIEDLLARTFAAIRPELHAERITALRNLQLLKDTLFQFSQVMFLKMLRVECFILSSMLRGSSRFASINYSRINKKIKEHPEFSQDFVNQHYCQNNAS